MTFQMKKRDWAFAFGMAVLAAGLSWALLPHRFAVCHDEVNYLKLGLTAASQGMDRLFHPFWPPLFPAVIALVSHLVHDGESAGRLISILSGALLTVLLYRWSASHAGRRPAQWTVLLWAGSASMAFANTAILTEPLYTLLVFSAVGLGWSSLDKKSIPLSLGTGVLFATAYLTRPEGIGFLAVFLAWSVGRGFIHRRDGLLGRRVTMASAVLFVFVIVSLPYWIWLHQATGEWTISAKGKSQLQGEAFAFTRDAGMKDPFLTVSEDGKLPLDQLYHQGDFVKTRGRGETQLIKVRLGTWIAKYSKNLYAIWKDAIPKALTSPLFALSILGLFGIQRNRAMLKRDVYLAAFAGFFIVLVIPTFHITDRYFMPLFPFFFIWAGQGVARLADWAEAIRKALKPPPRKWIGPVLIILTFSVVLMPQVFRVASIEPYSTDPFADPVEMKDAGLWIKAHSERPPIVMSTSHAVDYYAGNLDIRNTVTVPQESVERVIDYARSRGAEYLVLTGRRRMDCPLLSPLLTGSDIPHGLTLVYSKMDSSGLPTVIYRIGPS